MSRKVDYYNGPTVTEESRREDIREARKILANCSHPEVHQKEVLIRTCDGYQRTCVDCGYSELQDCYRKYNSFYKLANSKVV